ncbi:unnamed protein product [Rhizoctonia solani]|uniref:Uncharacterized protein n=1 Tax=Rhizoctonia solani TaxID=456999 RepID=A0A8H3B1N0_9AGAM|nr:unnamed protein product [Rhizoctonia solani]
MQLYNVFALALASVSVSATRPVTPTQLAIDAIPTTSAGLATVTEFVNLTSTVTVPAPSSSSTSVRATEAVVATTPNATSSVTSTGDVLTSALSSTSVCDTATPSVITSIVTQVSTKTVDHFITVTVGGSGSAFRRKHFGLQRTGRPTFAKYLQIHPGTNHDRAKFKPVTTAVVEQTTTVFVTSFATTTFQIQAGETRTQTAMVTSTVTSTGVATHTRTRTSTILVTLTKINTAEATPVATNVSTTKGTKTRTKSQNSLSTSGISSTPRPTDPFTLTVTRSVSEATTTTSRFGIKDGSTTSRSSGSRFTTNTRSTSLAATKSAEAESTTRSSRVTSTARSSRSTSVIQSTTDAGTSTLVATTQARTSDVTSTSRGGRTRTRTSTVPISTTLTSEEVEASTASETPSQVTTSTRATRSASFTISRFSSVVSETTTDRSNTRTRTSSAPAASATDSANPQTSLKLDPRAVMSALANDGQDNSDPGQVASLTSRNNFINFCLTENVPLTNGQQIKSGSCNGVPMGRILAVNKMPSSKFVFPKNGQTIKANTAFTIRMAIKNLSTGNFVNPATNYYGAPAQTTADGTLIGHSHVVIEKLTSRTQTTPTDPQKFAFFKGLNQAAVGGVLTADVTSGLPAGEYRIASINSAANHQPALSAVAQRGSNDDISYFTVE